MPTVRVYSRDEFKQSELRDEVGSLYVRFIIGDVRDRDHLRRAAEGCDTIIHAAALKQVPSCEANPFEAVATNILGTQNVINVALDCGIQKSLLISSDKAVHPINVYGATKLCAEKIFVAANTYAGGRDVRFSCVRYGNVVGSRGSVHEVFAQQAKNGPVTLTDERATRFWITPEQAIRFVLSALEDMVGGEVFVPKLPSSRVVDVATGFGQGYRVLGLRPGEKLHEVLITSEESRRTVEREDRYVIMPALAKPVLPEDFVYSSAA